MSVKIKDLVFSYKNERTLDGVVGHMKKGEFVSVLGPNGTGKSTLIKCINGLLKPQNGSLHIHSVDINAMTRKEISRQISYVPQSTNNLFDMSVFDMVLLGRRPHIAWRSSKEDRVKALKAMKYLNIDDLALKNFNELSGGQQQKVVIARALVQETEIIILDEPISNLDIRHQIEVMEIVRNLVDTMGITAICIIHDLNIATRYSDKVVVLNKGKAVAVGSPQSVLTEEMIASVYGVEAQLTTVNDELLIIPNKVKY
jgi:iron complex transport system ATP-binding protein